METELIPINERLALPASELQFRFSTSGGPGGQHVNKTATRVTLLFDVAGSPSLDDKTRARLLDQLSSRLDRRGLLHIDVQDSRSQWRNREMAVARLQQLLADALTERPERRPTRPTRRAREERVEAKRRRGSMKQERGRRWDE